MNVKDLAAKYESYVIEMRRHFHANPELSWQETETTKFITEELKKMGLEPKLYERTGVSADIRGGKAGPNSKTILLRGDIDALPVLEKTGAPYASKVEGLMHACGHDAHGAMLLGAAKILKDLQPELTGTVRLLFQASEETATGAKYYVEQGILDGVDASYGSHVMGDLEAPYINIEPGPRFASADQFRIDVKGLSSHGSAPHTAKDAVVAAAAIIMNLQTIVSRETDPQDALVITIGTIQAGTRFNIIAGEATMEGTLRTHSREVRARVEAQMRKVIETTAEALGCTATLDYTYLVNVVENDPAMTALVQQSATKLFGEDVLRSRNKAMGSEDFAELSSTIPGAFACLGTANPAKGLTAYNHNDKFDIEESALKDGTALYAQVAVDFLS